MSPFRTRPTARALVVPFAAALLVSVALSGCTLKVSDPKADEPASHVNTNAKNQKQNQKQNQKHKSQNDDDDEDVDDDIDDIENVDNGEVDDVDDIGDGDGTSTIDCTSLDPFEVLHIDSAYDNEIVTVNGDCGDVSISASHATIYLRELNDMEVLGDGNTVITKGILSVSFSGNNNTVTWTDGDGDVTDNGSNNNATHA